MMYEPGAFAKWALAQKEAEKRGFVFSGKPPEVGKKARRKVSKWAREKLYREASRLCPYCAVHMKHASWGDKTVQNQPDLATVDHRIPRAKGGTNHFNNLQLCCFQCNQRKSDDDAPPVATKSAPNTLAPGVSLYDVL